MSPDPQRVILYGDSLILAGVRTSLADSCNLEILVLEPSQKLSIEDIRACCPAVFVFDLGAVQPDFQLALLQLPGLLLVGIDPETHQALVWSGRQEAAVEAADVLHVIQQSEFSIPVTGGKKKRPNRISGRRKEGK